MRTILWIMIGFSTLMQAERFVKDATTQIVTDTQTNLRWQDDAAVKTTQVSWQNAIDYCESLELGDKNDWRLPNFNELYYIVDRSTSNPEWKNVFENVNFNYYWSSTTYASNKSRVWVFHFGNGLDEWGDKSGNYRVICVRDGQ